MESSNRDSFGDVLKGIGIIMIVMGHSWLPTVPYVYTSHLALFFLVMGLHFSEKKYCKTPLLMFSNRLTTLWPQYVIYTSLFVILRNLFLDIGFYSTSIQRYTLGGVIQNILYSFVFYSSEQMGGALWFVAMFLIGSAFMGLIFYFGNKYFPDDSKGRYVSMAIIFAIIGIIGLLAINKGMNLPFNYQTAMLLLPISYIGFIFSKHKEIALRYITWYGTLIIAMILWYLVGKNGIRIDGPAGEMITILLYYPITLGGLYICLWIGKISNSNKFISLILSKVGKRSFEIMALHFLAFKIIDFIYTQIFIHSLNDLNGFPTSYSKLGPIYVIFGVVIPIIMVVVWEYIIKKLRIWVDQYFLRADKIHT